MQHTPITLDDYKYPLWGDGMGLFLSISSMVCIPIYFVYKIIVSPGSTLYEVNNDYFKKARSFIIESVLKNIF